MSNVPSFFIKFIKFGLVGFSGLVVDFGITFLLKEKLKLPKYLSNAIGFIVATFSNYMLNRYWTFYMRGKEAAFIEFSKFFGIASLGLLFNTIILYLLHEKWGKNFYLSKFAAIMLVSLWNFFANYYYTFSVTY
ncbi:GtrA family protein [Olivibacter sitiensis]|uniref:GtrA family protein n=1 Tax=Olivibacter sitiensis TaxID=376470 RepID=UPI00048A10BE|nr:GtrA family protein [Olivibacter sitiensis]